MTYTQGYPYFLRSTDGRVGRILRVPISEDDARSVQPIVEERLDESFFRVRAERTTELELRYL